MMITKGLSGKYSEYIVSRSIARPLPAKQIDMENGRNDRKGDEKDEEKDAPVDCYLYGATFYRTQSMANYSKLNFNICSKTDHQSHLLSHSRGIPFNDSSGMVGSHNMNGNYSDSDDEDTNIDITGGIASGMLLKMEVEQNLL